LEEIAASCEKKGIRAAFYLRTFEQERPQKNIHYLDELIPYEETLDIIKRSKCLLELKINEINTCSVRVQEAVIYNKKLLTDNKNVYKMPCCKGDNNISYFDNTEDIDWDFLLDNEPADYHYKDEFSAAKLLENISARLSGLSG
jgi:hypothetical protein